MKKILQSILWGLIGFVVAVVTGPLVSFLIGESLAVGVFCLILPIIFFVRRFKSSDTASLKTLIQSCLWGYLAFAVSSLLALVALGFVLGGNELLLTIARDLVGAIVGIFAFVSSSKNGGKAPAWLYQAKSRRKKQNPEGV